MLPSANIFAGCQEQSCVFGSTFHGVLFAAKHLDAELPLASVPLWHSQLQRLWDKVCAN